MNTKLKSFDEFSLLVDQLAIELYEEIDTEEMLDRCKRFLFDKKSTYSVEEYPNKLLSQSIYQNETAYFCAVKSADYLCSGKVKKGMAPELDLLGSTMAIVDLAHRSTDDQVNFILHNCSGCNFHYRHTQYQEIKTIRNSRSKDEYISTLEFNQVYYQFTNDISRLFNRAIISNPDYYSIAKRFSKSDITKILYERVVTRAQIWSGLTVPAVRFTPDGELQQLSGAEIKKVKDSFQISSFISPKGKYYEPIILKTVNGMEVDLDMLPKNCIIDAYTPRENIHSIVWDGSDFARDRLREWSQRDGWVIEYRN